MSIDEFGTKIEQGKKVETKSGQVLKDESDCGIPTTAPQEEKLNTDFCQWAILPNSTYCAASQATTKLQSGFYSVSVSRGTIYFRQENLITDELLTLDDTAKQITGEITNFWSIKDKFYEYGFSHRRGYLFYGKAGTGKTSIVKQILSLIIKNNGLALNCNSHPSLISEALALIRMIEPKRNILCIFEDIDSIINTFGEQEILSILDGEHVIDNVLNIATTNYPEELDKRIVCRPRRFDRIIKIGTPNADIRRQYFTRKLNLTNSEVEEYVKISSGFTYAALSDLVISTKCFSLSLEEAAERLRELEKDKSSNEYYNKETGFV